MRLDDATRLSTLGTVLALVAFAAALLWALHGCGGPVTGGPLDPEDVRSVNLYGSLGGDALSSDGSQGAATTFDATGCTGARAEVTLVLHQVDETDRVHDVRLVLWGALEVPLAEVQWLPSDVVGATLAYTASGGDGPTVDLTLSPASGWIRFDEAGAAVSGRYSLMFDNGRLSGVFHVTSTCEG
ncbi:MAG: hypothetical protein HY906_10235 [Deltaproteobacteria bacterium]|nr:hypothetical protein [Deltaproteobacteria bacterium]